MTALALAPLLPGLLRKRVCACDLRADLLLSAALTIAAALALHSASGLGDAQLEQSLDPQIWWLLLSIGLAGLVIVALTRVRRAPLGWLLFAGVLWGTLRPVGLSDAQRRSLGARRDAAGARPSPGPRQPSACWHGRSRTC
jgi:hypothetical protein